MKIGGFKQIEDLPFVDFPTIMELSLIGKFKYNPRILGYFRRHDASISHNLRKNELDFVIKAKKMFKYTEDFVKKNEKKIDELGISLKNLGRITSKKGNWISYGSYVIVQGKELIELGKMIEARKTFQMVLKKECPLSFKLLAHLGIVSTYCHLNFIDLIVRFYWSVFNFYRQSLHRNYKYSREKVHNGKY
jgi:hypothetical protein